MKTRKQKGGDINTIIGATAIGAAILWGANEMTKKKTYKKIKLSNTFSRGTPEYSKRRSMSNKGHVVKSRSNTSVTPPPSYDSLVGVGEVVNNKNPSKKPTNLKE